MSSLGTFPGAAVGARGGAGGVSGSGGGSGAGAGSGGVNRPRGHRGRFISQNKEQHRRCKKCQVDETSQWRTADDGLSLCNKCGIREKRENKKQRERAKSTLHNKLAPLQSSPRSVALELPSIHTLDATATPQKPSKRRKSRPHDKMDLSKLLN